MDGLMERNGTSQGEVLMFQMLGPISVILRNIALPWIFIGRRFASDNEFWLKYLLDFILLVLPTILSLTIFSDHISVILLLQILSTITLAFFYWCEYCFIARDKPQFRNVLNQVIDEQHMPTMFVTYMRSMVLLATAAAILAVDFPVFPTRFAKTTNYGRSIMDVGTASFVFCLAVVDVFRDYPNYLNMNPVRNKRKFEIFYSSSAILFYIGILRSMLIKLTNYPYDISEYGIHWNFFLTLSFVKILTKIFGRRFHFFFGVIFLCIGQLFCMNEDFQEWIISNQVSRDDFFSANKEGLFSLLGYLSFYYFSSSIAKFVASTGIRLKSWFYRSFQLLMLACLLFFVQKFMESFFGLPSRRITNSPYVIEMLVFHCIYLALFLFVQLASMFGWAAQMPLFSTDESPFERTRPCLLNSINHYGIFFFLLTNLLTGFVNLGMDTSKCISAYQSTSIILIYMFISCTIINGLYFKKTRSWISNMR